MVGIVPHTHGNKGKMPQYLMKFHEITRVVEFIKCYADVHAIPYLGIYPNTKTIVSWSFHLMFQKQLSTEDEKSKKLKSAEKHLKIAKEERKAYKDKKQVRKIRVTYLYSTVNMEILPVAYLSP